jgi:hypothetical protein
MVAGPLTIEYVIAPHDGELESTSKVGSPTTWLGIGVIVSAGTSAAIVKLVVTVAAG